MRVDASDTAAMEAFGRELAGMLRAGDLVLLTGPLGAGKTTLTRGIGDGLGVRGPVQSPTFVLARTHPNLAGGPPLVHVDAYRLGDAMLLDDASESWLEIVIERPEGAPLPVMADAADAEHLGADEPRVLDVRGHGPRWAGTPFDAAQ